MDWGRILMELRIGLAELSRIRAVAFWLVVAVLIVLFAGRGLLLMMSFLLSLR